MSCKKKKKTETTSKTCQSRWLRQREIEITDPRLGGKRNKWEKENDRSDLNLCTSAKTWHQICKKKKNLKLANSKTRTRTENKIPSKRKTKTLAKIYEKILDCAKSKATKVSCKKRKRKKTETTSKDCQWRSLIWHGEIKITDPRQGGKRNSNNNNNNKWEKKNNQSDLNVVYKCKNLMPNCLQGKEKNLVHI